MKSLLSNRILQLTLFVITLAILCVQSVLRTFQGIDFTDSGFYLSSYKYFFSAPENIIYSQMYWLSNFFGAVIWWLTNGSGILVMNLAGVALFVLLIWYSFRVWKPYYESKVNLSWVIFLSAALVIPYTFMVNYNNLSLLLMGVSSLLLVQFVDVKKRSLIFWSGFLFGLSVGCRFPNIVFVVAVLFLLQADRKQALKDMGLFILALGISLLGQLALIFALGHQEVIKEALVIVGRKAVDTESTHSLGRLIRTYIADFLGSYRKVIYICILLFAGRYLLLKKKVQEVLQNKNYENILYAILGIIIFLLAFPESGSRLNLVFTVLALTFFAIKDKCRVSYLFLVFTLSLSSGSNSGLFNSRSAFIVTLPWLLYKVHQMLKEKASYRAIYTARFAYLLLLVISLKSFKEIWRDTYRDSANPAEMTVRTEVPVFKGMYTTPARAQMINELYEQLQKIPAGSQIIPYSEMALVFTMGDWYNPIFNVWPDGYEHSQFLYAFNKGVVETGIKPVIIFNKLSLRDRGWPTSEARIPGREEDRNYILLNKFKAANNYSLLWENSYFEIWSGQN